MGGVVPFVVQAGCSLLAPADTGYGAEVSRAHSFPQLQRESPVLGLPGSCTDF